MTDHITFSEACRLLDWSASRVLSYVRKGLIRSYRFAPKCLMVLRQDVEKVKAQPLKRGGARSQQWRQNVKKSRLVDDSRPTYKSIRHRRGHFFDNTGNQ